MGKILNKKRCKREKSVIQTKIEFISAATFISDNATSLDEFSLWWFSLRFDTIQKGIMMAGGLRVQHFFSFSNSLTCELRQSAHLSLSSSTVVRLIGQISHYCSYNLRRV